MQGLQIGTCEHAVVPSRIDHALCLMGACAGYLRVRGSRHMLCTA